MFKYNSIITIFRKGDDIPLYKFTYYSDDMKAPSLQAQKWIAENIPPEKRKGVFYEVVKVEHEIEIFKGI